MENIERIIVIPEGWTGKLLKQIMEARICLVSCAKNQRKIGYKELACACPSINDNAWHYQIGKILGHLSEIEEYPHELNSLVRHASDGKVGKGWTGGDEDPEIYTQRAFNRYK